MAISDQTEKESLTRLLNHHITQLKNVQSMYSCLIDDFKELQCAEEKGSRMDIYYGNLISRLTASHIGLNDPIRRLKSELMSRRR